MGLGKELKYHFTDSTSLSALMSPIYAAVDVFIAGMSDEISIKAKVIGTGFGYLGLGYAIMRGNDLSRKVFGITKETKEKVRWIHDTAYLTVANAVTAPLMYFLSGSSESLTFFLLF